MRRLLDSLALTATMLLAACSDPASPPGGPPVSADDENDRAVQSPGDTLFASVSTNGGTVCALTIGGRAFCWGSDDVGMLGTGGPVAACNFPDSSSKCSLGPVPVVGGRRFTALAVGSGLACGLAPSGRVYCWGGGSRWGPSPKLVEGDVRLRAIAPSGQAMCGLAEDGRAYCWGSNCNFELGSTPQGVGGGVCWLAVPEPFSPTPQPVDTELRFAALGRGCGVTSSGELHCWGAIDPIPFGREVGAVQSCGDPRSTGARRECTSRPLPLATAMRFVRPAGGAANCGVGVDGRAHCWGGPVSSLVPPQPASEAELAARRVNPLLFEGGISDVLLSGTATCAHATDGRVLCYGSQTTQPAIFGDGTTIGSSAVPIVAAGGQRFTAVSAASQVMCGVTPEGAILCWGTGNAGQLGTGTVPPACVAPSNPFAKRCSPVPVRIASIAGLVSR